MAGGVSSVGGVSQVAAVPPGAPGALNGAEVQRTGSQESG